MGRTDIRGSWAKGIGLGALGMACLLAGAATCRAEPPAPGGEGTGPRVRPYTAWRAPAGLSARERVALAHRNKDAEVRGLFAAAGVAFPPSQLLFQVFKQEHELEVWAATGTTGALTRVATYGICAAPRNPGPKNRQGDGQVPEGRYRVAAFNPASAYHLSMLVSYPNAADRRRSDARDLGGAIMIHGSCVSIGCIAMTDERIQELWVMAEAARDGGHPVNVHIYPARDLAPLIDGTRDPGLATFWRDLQQGLDRFARTRSL